MTAVVSAVDTKVKVIVAPEGESAAKVLVQVMVTAALAVTDLAVSTVASKVAVSVVAKVSSVPSPPPTVAVHATVAAADHTATALPEA